MAGLSAGIFILGAIGGRLYAGSSIELIGYKKMLYFGLAFSLITTLLYFAVSSLVILIAIRLIHGIAFGLTTTATGVVAAGIVPNERRGEGTGYYALSTTLAIAIGPFIGMYLIQHANFNANLIVCAIVLGANFFTVFLLKIPQDNLTNQEASHKKEFRLSNFFEVKALPISIVVALICFEYSCVLSFLSSYTKSINLLEAGSVFFIAYSASSIISRPFAGRLFDLKGANFVIYPEILLITLALFMLSEAKNGYTIMLAGVVMGCGYSNFFASALALAIKSSPQDRRALAISTLYIFAELGQGLGPFVLGLFLPFLGYSGLYFGMAILVLPTGLLYFFLHRK